MECCWCYVGRFTIEVKPEDFSLSLQFRPSNYFSHWFPLGRSIFCYLVSPEKSSCSVVDFYTTNERQEAPFPPVSKWCTSIKHTNVHWIYGRVVFLCREKDTTGTGQGSLYYLKKEKKREIEHEMVISIHRRCHSCDVCSYHNNMETCCWADSNNNFFLCITLDKIIYNTTIEI